MLNISKKKVITEFAVKQVYYLKTVLKIFAQLTGKYLQKQPLVVVFCKKSYSWKFRTIHTKTPALEF